MEVNYPYDIRLLAPASLGKLSTNESRASTFLDQSELTSLYRMNYGPVLERLAHWDHGTGATFLEETVQPDNTLDQLLDHPREAFQEIFGDCSRKPWMSEEVWRGHVFSQKSVIAELCAWSNRERGFLDILADL